MYEWIQIHANRKQNVFIWLLNSLVLKIKSWYSMLQFIIALQNKYSASIAYKWGGVVVIGRVYKELISAYEYNLGLL